MTTTPLPPKEELPELRTALIATAPSLSGLSDLEYHFGYLASSRERIYFRLWKNSGNGKFNKDWIALSDIEKALAKVPVGGSFTVEAFSPLFARRSTNSPFFLIACLLHAGLLQRTEEGYVRHTAPEWWASLQALIAAGTHLKSASMGQGAGPVTDSAATKTKKTAGVAKGGGLAKPVTHDAHA